MATGLLFFRPLIGILLDRWGRKPVLWMGLIVMFAILPLYWWSPTPEWLMGVRGRIFFGYSCPRWFDSLRICHQFAFAVVDLSQTESDC